MDKKTFALEQLRPYAKDPSLCGINNNSECVNLTPDGRMCVAGKNLLNPEIYKGGITGLLRKHGEDILKPEARGILTIEEWGRLQWIHDEIAKNDDMSGLTDSIERLNLFTYEELFN